MKRAALYDLEYVRLSGRLSRSCVYQTLFTNWYNLPAFYFSRTNRRGEIPSDHRVHDLKYHLCMKISQI